MSDRVANALREFAGPTRPPVFTATVEEVDGEVCKVIPHTGGPPLYEVSLRSSVLFSGTPLGLIQIPVVGSSVTCGWMSRDRATVLVFTELESFEVVKDSRFVRLDDDGIVLKDGTTQVVVSAQGIELSKGPESLKGILDGILSQLLVMAPISAAPGSPSVPNSADITAFSQLIVKLNTLLV